MSRFDPKTKSRARLGADHARVWARELCLRNPYAKAIMLALANYMNEHGAAHPGISTIASDTDISEDTVVQRLRWLESIGAIALFKCWVDENGRRNFDGRGRVTSSEIRFLYEADIDAIEAAAQQGTKPQSLRGAALESAKQIRHQGDTGPRHGREQNTGDETGVSPGVAPEQPPPPAARTEELEQDSPQNPPLPAAASVPDPPGAGTPYESFAEVYGEGSVRPQQARTLWYALSEPERDLAIRGARGYRAQRQSAKKSLIDPERFLRSRDLWTEFATKAAADAASMRAVPLASDEGRAMTCLSRLAGKTPFTFQSGGETVCSIKGELPAQALRLAECVDARGQPIGKWQSIDVGSNAFGAWCELTGKTVGRRLMVRPGETTVMVPAPWPPRADGSWPELNSTDDDIDHLGKTG